jgi:adenylate kinase
MARLTGRWNCPNCGAIYHELTSPPQQPGKCDRCGAELTQRADDRPDTVATRLATNRSWTEQLADFYGAQGKLHPVDGTGEPSDVTGRLLTEIDAVSARAEKA